MKHTLIVTIVLTTFWNTLQIIAVAGYSKVSKNGVQAISSQTESPSGQNKSDSLSENRSFQDISITTPAYLVPRTPLNLNPGEVIDYHSFKMKQFNDRYTPPSIIQTGKKVRGNSNNNNNMNSDPPISQPDIPFPALVYDYSTPNYFMETKSNKNKSTISESEQPSYYKGPKLPDAVQTYESQGDLSNFDGIYEDKPPNADEYLGPHGDHVPYLNHDFEYNHPHSDHQFYHYYDHHDHTTTEKPEPNDQRLSKRPYSYYFIGKKLWYLPLYFSIYFIIYVAALVLKSVARHKINFPVNLAAAAADARGLSNNDYGWYDYVHWILQVVENYVTSSK